MIKKFRKIILIIAVLFLGAAIFVWWSNYKIEEHTEPFVTGDISKLSYEKVGLVLGTSKTLKSGYKNYYFYHRIDAAEKLFKENKVHYLIVSGDNSQKNYNEPEDMMKELVARGIPQEKIFMDFAGLRTLDSVVRAKEIFGQKAFIIISQKFHNERAVFIARKHGIEAYGFNAKDVSKNAGLKTKIREKFARAKVFLDFLLGVDPKFDGPKVVIP